jgi:hypothetical protein
MGIYVGANRVRPCGTMVATQILSSHSSRICFLMAKPPSILMVLSTPIIHRYPLSINTLQSHHDGKTNHHFDGKIDPSSHPIRCGGCLHPPSRVSSILYPIWWPNYPPFWWYFQPSISNATRYPLTLYTIYHDGKNNNNFDGKIDPSSTPSAVVGASHHHA